MDTTLQIKRILPETFLQTYSLVDYPVKRAIEKYLLQEISHLTPQVETILTKLLADVSVSEEDLVVEDQIPEEAVAPPPPTQPQETEKIVARKSNVVKSRKTVSAKVTKVAKASKTKKASAAEAKTPRGREPTYSDGLKIKLLVSENPKRGASAERFDLYKNGMTVGDYIAAGGKRSDIAWDVKKEFISVG